MRSKWKKTVLPARLKTGDTIGIAAPAGPFDRDKFDAGIAVVESMGFCTRVLPEAYDKKGYFAGEDRARADQLNRLFADPEIQGIICARGGYGSMRILPMLDAAAIEGKPKVFVGFSDVTALLWIFYARFGMAVFHGPMITTLASAGSQARASFINCLTSEVPPVMSPPDGVILNPGSARGPVVCGNLATLCHLVGTGFDPYFNGCILVLEDCNEALYRIDRMLTQMMYAGCFDGVAGLVLGTFAKCAEMDTIYPLMMEKIGGRDIPVVGGFPVGHGGENLTVPIGAEAVLTTDPVALTYLVPPTRPRG